MQAGDQRPAIETDERLEDLLSEPTPEVVETLGRLDGDIVVLGAGGKMGPSLARMARRALDEAGKPRRVVAVSRFEAGRIEAQLHGSGVTTLRADLLDESAVAALPDAPNVVFMAGMKFGSTGRESLTWAMNAYVPALVARRYRRSRIVAFSTGNVYGLTPVTGAGSLETDPPQPVGEYAMSCLGRERIFEHFSRTLGTPVALLRLNYATELRYGVLVDLALQVQAAQPIDLAMGSFNCIWQADANATALRCLALAASPPFVVNVTGPETLSVREVSERLGRLLDRPARFSGIEAEDALLSNSGLCRRLFGPPRVDAAQMTAWVAEWVRRGGATHGKPTHFQAREGRF